MGGRHSETSVRGEDGWQVVDVTGLSPGDIRARITDLEDGREATVEQARDDLAESIVRLREGVVLLRGRVVERVRAALPVVAGAAAVGTTGAVIVRVGTRRSRRARRAAMARHRSRSTSRT